jgi:hypothetical protein
MIQTITGKETGRKKLARYPTIYPVIHAGIQVIVVHQHIVESEAL